MSTWYNSSIMHEASIAKGILETSLAAMPATATKILRVTVVAGVLSGVEDQSVQLYFEQLAKGTAARGAALELKRKPARLACTSCEWAIDFEPTGELVANCPICKATCRLTGGNELYIESMETEDED